MLILLLICLLLAPLPAAAQELGQEQSEGPVNLKADTVHFDHEAETYTATGNVLLTRGQDWLTADRVVFQRQTAEAQAEGDVHALVDGNEVWGNQARLNMETKTGVVEQGTLFMPLSGYIITGEELEKTGPETFHARQAILTTCTGERPAWSFAAREVVITYEGYALAYQPTFRIKNVPVLYSPFFVLPAKKKRQTGFLTPRFGNSTLDGFTFGAPFFWAISDSQDATVYADLMTKRGVMTGIEYRYMLSPRSLGTVWGTYLDDSVTDTRFQALDNTARRNRQRWWLRGKFDQEMPAGFFARGDLDLVSDQDYLREFSGGPQSFSATNGYFLKAFGRSLQEYTDQVRESAVVASRSWGSAFLSAEAHYFQNLVSSQEEFTLQRLPSVRFDMARSPVPGSPLYYELHSEYDNFFREVNPDVAPRGQRLDLQPALSLPLTLGRYANLTPAVAVRETMYLAEGAQDGIGVDGFNHREAYNLSANLSTEVARIFRIEGEELRGVKHIVRPELTYSYQPEVDQKALPNFDSVDRLGAANLLGFQVTNDFIGKLVTGTTANYPQIARLRLGNALDLNQLGAAPGSGAHPFQPLTGHLEFGVPGLSLDAEAEWDWYLNDFTRYSILGSWSDKRGDNLAVDYFFRQGTAHEINVRATAAINRSLAAYTVQRLAVDTGQQVENTIGFHYVAQCWSVDLHYTKEPWDDRVVVMFSLAGLGELGSFGFSPGSFLGGGGAP